MSKIQIINTILHQKFCDKSQILREVDKDKKGKVFEMKRKIISSRDIEYTLYKYDQKKDIFPFFTDTDTDTKKDDGKGISHLKKMCDYILFVEERVHLFVFLIELKKGRHSSGKRQLEAGECFVNYLMATINRLNIDINLTGNNLHFKQIQITESRSNKKKLIHECLKENGVYEHPHSKDFHIKFYLD
ncbi:MAG: hypothetical protein L3J23_06665 [Flavobacteriaceae bacterium]|nr:hypothetical protein [Flavobacteriaceae bacterium]